MISDEAWRSLHKDELEETPLDAPDPVMAPSLAERTEAFRKDLEELINEHSMENVCDIPDYMLAEHLVDHMLLLARTVNARDKWFDFDPFSGEERVKGCYWFEVKDSEHIGFFIEHNLGTRKVTFEFFLKDGTPVPEVTMEVTGTENDSILTLSKPIPRLSHIRVMEV